MGNPYVFGVLAVIAIGSGVGMLTSRNAVYSALYLVLNFATIGVFYIVLNAPFIAMVQITVYAGAIMVLFLFVIMLLGGVAATELQQELIPPVEFPQSPQPAPERGPVPPPT